MSDTDVSGFSLVEVLVSIVLLGIGVTAVMTGMITASRGSGDTRGLVDQRQVLLSAADRLLAAGYAPCAGADPAGPYAGTLATVVLPNSNGANVSANVQVFRVDYWDGTDRFVTSCTYDSTAGARSRMQRLTLRTDSDSLVIVKRAD